MSGINGFDFLIGNWRVQHRRLRERLANNTDWIDFEGSCVTRKILNGAGNVDEHALDLPGERYHALAIRTYDTVTEKWSIWWFDGRHPSRLNPPVLGAFDGDTGTFYAEDSLEGRPIRIRFMWTNVLTKPRWQQAFSNDAGNHWETNWVMEFNRLPT
jgi:hypothetical protein